MQTVHIPAIEEKRFHGCVLAASPFFNQILSSEFLERQTGTIEMAIGTPVTLEMAVMFLYGRKPVFTTTNIKQMMDLAEFLLIPNLKSACVYWVRSLPITTENCMEVIEFSSMYEFDVPECTEYFEGHMLEMLQTNRSLNLTPGCILTLFSDPKLSYVPMDFKLSFLVRWANANHEQRKNTIFKGLIEKTIDFNDVSRKLLWKLNEDQNLNDFIDFKTILSSPRNTTTRRVLIMKSFSNREFWCLDLKREKWFILASTAYEGDRLCRNNEIFCSRSNGSEVYFKSTDKPPSVCILDLEADTFQKYRIDIQDTRTDFKQISIVGNTCVAIGNESWNRQVLEKNIFSPDIDDSSRLSLFSRRRMNEIGGSCDETILTDISSLYFGIIDKECIEMSRCLCVEGHCISKICANKINNLTIVAILDKSWTNVSIFDIGNHKMEKIQVNTDPHDELERCEDGFVVYNDRRCICLTMQEMQSLPIRFEKKQIWFENRYTLYSSKYFLRGSYWYHYYCEDYRSQFKFEKALHSDVISNGSFEKAEWKPLPTLGELSKYCARYSGKLSDWMFEISLTKSKLLCDIECPHCRATGRATGNAETTWYSDTDDDYDDDDDDDDDNDDDDDDDDDDVYYGDEFYDDGYGYYYDDLTD